MTDKVYLSWNYIDIATDDLVLQIKESELHIDQIIGIPRGGLIPAVILSHKLNIPLAIIPARHLTGTILLVDDIIDSGYTLQNNLAYIITNFPNITKVITASINITSKSTFRPDFYHEKFTDKWLVYSWETEATSKLDYMEK